MHLLVLSQSPSFENYLTKILATDNQIDIFPSIDQLDGEDADDVDVILLHVASCGENVESLFANLRKLSPAPIGVSADIPALDEMLRLSSLGASAYFNSYMAETHYRQMLAFIAVGQHWYLPGLLASALRIARDIVESEASVDNIISSLTKREKEVALMVAEGLSNKEIANQCGITERTIKAHLTKIFKKTGVPDRVSLAILINTNISAH